MAKKVERVEFRTLPPPKVKRVAAYARVSSAKDAMLHSLAAQVSYYSTLIQSHADWTYCGVYSDEGLTGTKVTREGFIRLMADCRSGKIDLVIVKSVSRFARNTVALLEAVRELKLLGIGVFFEEQNINSLTSTGELMLTLLASFAQEESLSTSENMKWRIKKNFEEGKPWYGRMLGYRYDKGVYKVVPEEAVIVKRIFEEYLSGKGGVAIMNGLNKDGIPSPFGNKWCKTAIMKILRQYTYTGNLLLQRYFVNNHLEKKVLINNGEKPMYHVENSHEAIIPMEMFTEVQALIALRQEHYGKPGGTKNTYPLSGKIECSNCGKNYRRKTTATGIVWACATYSYQGKEACPSKQIPEDQILAAVKEVLGVSEITAEFLDAKVEKIIADHDFHLTFCLRDGTEVVKTWKVRSRSESWTEEKRKAMSEKKLQRARI